MSNFDHLASESELDVGEALPDSVRAALRSASADQPTGEQLLRLEARLGESLGWSGAPTAAPAAQSWLASIPKALQVLGVGAIVTAGAVVFVRSQPSEQPFLQPTPVERRIEQPSRVELPQLTRESQPAVQLQVVPAATETPELAAEEVAPESSPRAQSGRPRAAHAARATQPAADLASTLVEQARLLRRGQQQLQSDPQAALGVVAEYRRRFPGGEMNEESEAITITALRRLSRDAEADARLRRFKARYPQSPHLMGGALGSAP